MPMVALRPPEETSSILRAADDDSRHEEMRKFIDDLKVVAQKLSQRKAA